MPEIYHVLNRGVDKRKIFLDKQDYFRFVHDLFELNDQSVVDTGSYRFQQKNKTCDIECRNINFIERKKKPRKLLVDIYAFCQMPNHYHLFLNTKVDNGIPRFMQKVNMGYSKYFNQKYKRKGTLFEGRYKSILVKQESHFYHLPYYIHLNPLDLKFPEWRVGELKNYKDAIKFLENYRWASHLEYIGKKNFPSVTNREFLTEVFGGEKEYNKSVEHWLKNLELEDIRSIVLE